MASTSSAGNAAPGYSDHPGYRVDLVPCAKRVRATLAGQTVFDTQRAVVMCETAHIALYYVPREDADMSMMTRTDHSTFCPFKGQASYYTLTAGDRVAENAVWSYETPFDEAIGIEGLAGVLLEQLDHWFEEDEEVFIHARDPFVRMRHPRERAYRSRSWRRRNRRQHSTVQGSCSRPATKPRYYIPREDVTGAALMPSELRTGCPYKGTAHYHHIKAGGTTIDDAVWYYPAPLDEVRRIGDYLCFYPEKVDAILVDGKKVR